jgi:preprotein translocase subunit SecF
MVVLMRSDTLNATDPAFASAATQLLDNLQAQPGVVSVASYYSTQSPRFLSRDGHETFAAVQFAATDPQAKENDYKALKPLITSSTLQVSVGGDLAVNDAVNAQVSADLERAEIISFPVLAILLVIVFAGLVAAGLPLVIGGVAILGAFAALRLLTGLTPISIFAVNVVTVLGLGLAIDYALFIVTRFREELNASAGDTRYALERTLTTAGRTVLFSGLTVSVSLLGLLLFPEGFLRSMGLGAISAVLIAMLAALILLPALLAILGRRVNSLSLQSLFRRSGSSGSARQNHETRGAWYRLSQFVMRWPVPVAVAGLAILVTLGGAAGSRLLRALGVMQCRSTLLRQVSALSLDAPIVGPAIGIDEFAFRRGRRFGTIIVELATRRVLDLLPTVEAEQVIAWLRAHPQIQVVSRDRAYNFGEAIRQGAPLRSAQAAMPHIGKRAPRVGASLEPPGVHGPQPLQRGRPHRRAIRRSGGRRIVAQGRLEQQIRQLPLVAVRRRESERVVQLRRAKPLWTPKRSVFDCGEGQDGAARARPMRGSKPGGEPWVAAWAISQR